MFAEISSLAPWLLTAAALCLLFAQGMMLRRENRKLREQMKERCETLGRELHATASGSMGVGQRVVTASASFMNCAVCLTDRKSVV